MRITLVHNPEAGYHGLTQDDVLRMIRDGGYDPTVISSRDDLDQALADPGEMVVVAGGDGTVAKVAIKLTGREIPTAILPLGTANNIATSLGIVGSMESQVAAWPRARQRQIDLGCARGRWGEEYFLESFGVGLFAQTIRNVEPMHDAAQQKLQSREAEFDHALREMKKILQRTAARKYMLDIDGVDHSGLCVLVEAMNLPCLGPNFPLAPHADAADGKLDVALVPEAAREAFIESVDRRIAGDPIAPDLPVHRASRVVIDAKGAPLHIDDNLHSESHDPLEPTGPIELFASPGRLRFVIP